jgi:hypothetical protein
MNKRSLAKNMMDDIINQYGTNYDNQFDANSNEGRLEEAYDL